MNREAHRPHLALLSREVPPEGSEDYAEYDAPCVVQGCGEVFTVTLGHYRQLLGGPVRRIVGEWDARQ